jgi:hypothetical protein
MFSLFQDAKDLAVKLFVAFWLLCLVGLLINLYVNVAHAHDAEHASDWIANRAYISPAGKGYCCGENDCGVLDDNAVKPAPGGYQVHGEVHYFGSMAGVRERVDEFWPSNETLVSEDNHFWRCKMGGQPRCTFIPPTFSSLPIAVAGFH